MPPRVSFQFEQRHVLLLHSLSLLVAGKPIATSMFYSAMNSLQHINNKKNKNKNKTGGQAGEDWVAIKVIPPCHSVRVLGRGAHGQKQFVTVSEDMI